MSESGAQIDLTRPSRAFPNLHVSMHPLVRHKVTLLSDERTESKIFRELVRELTTLLLYEATTDLPVHTIRYRTPLEETEGFRIDAKIGIVPILTRRARDGRRRHRRTTVGPRLAPRYVPRRADQATGELLQPAAHPLRRRPRHPA